MIVAIIKGMLEALKVNYLVAVVNQSTMVGLRSLAFG
jgi:hypothetical protein